MSFVDNVHPVQLEGDFLVQIPGLLDLKFEKCSPIKGTINQIKRTMGGETSERKWAGNVTYDDITLERALTGDARIRAWFESCKSAIAQRGTLPTQYMREVSITRYAPNKVLVLKRDVLHKAWICDLDEGEHDADNANPAIQKMVLCYWYPVPVPV